jgi:hypothetical protein
LRISQCDLTEIGGSARAKKSLAIDAANGTKHQRRLEDRQWPKRQSKRIAKHYLFRNVKIVVYYYIVFILFLLFKLSGKITV